MKGAFVRTICSSPIYHGIKIYSKYSLQLKFQRKNSQLFLTFFVIISKTNTFKKIAAAVLNQALPFLKQKKIKVKIIKILKFTLFLNCPDQKILFTEG